MDTALKKQVSNPRSTANFVSILFFWWLHPFLRIGHSKDLSVEDLYGALPEDSSEKLGKKLYEEWKKELLRVQSNGKKVSSSRPSLARALYRAFGFQFILLGLFAFFEECVLRIGQPLCLSQLVHYFETGNPMPAWQAYLYASGVVMGSAVYVFTHHPYFFEVQHTGMKLRVASCSLVYRKCLQLSQKALGQTTIGQMVNLMSNDVNRFDFSVIFLHYLWVGPLQTVITMAILLHVIGPSCLVGLAVLMLFVPLQSWMGRVFSHLRMKTAKKTDERIRTMNEIVSGMRVIKMYTWEKPFAKLIELCRRKEVAVIRRTAYFRALFMSLFFTSSKLILFLTFLTYVLSGHLLNAEKVFLTVALFNNVRLIMTLFFPGAITQSAETRVSIQRIENFLLLDEVPQKPAQEIRPKLEDCSIIFDRVTVKWPAAGEQEDNTLTDISFTVQPGQILAVVGHVGSGKSSLLNVILGELSAHIGTVRVSGKMAYASQEPWIFSGTVRQNILCGREYDAKRYRKVVKVCALEKDFSLLPASDKTPVGERGVSLSGGQKARVNLARALYVDADIYLLDDPLSAVDTHVGRHLFDQSIVGFLGNKIRVLVTHQLQYLKDVDKIIILKQGRVEAAGTYQELMTSGVDLERTLAEEEEDDEKEKNPLNRSFSDGDMEVSLNRTGSVSNGSCRKRLGSTTSKASIASVKEEQAVFAEETRSSGAVSKGIYWHYFRAGGGALSFIVLVFNCIVAQILFSGTDYWLTVWTDAEELRSRHITTGLVNSTDNSTELDYSFLNETVQTNTSSRASWVEHIDTITGVYVYTILIVGMFIFSLIRSVHFFIMCMKSSISLHNTMFESVIRSPVLFFDKNPVGRILNRFTKDIGSMDELLPSTFFDVIIIFLTNIGILFLVGWVNMWLLLPVILLFILFYYFRRYYMESARDVKRLEATTRSPVFTHLSSSLVGLTTLRAHQAETIFQGIFDSSQDIHSSAWYMFLATTRWFGIWLDWICVIYVACVTYACVVLRDAMSPSAAGLAISSALMLTGSFQWGVRQSTEVENQMTSVERVIEYSKLPPEAALESRPGKQPPKTWPHLGKIIFDKMFLRYQENEPPVLKNISCVIEPKQKIGIVGRTGAGKSSLITSLFRMTEPEGHIYVDGIDAKSIGLHELRSKISIIPQDPVLFSGTLRKNLDPFDEYTDDVLWSSLESVKLKEAVKDLSAGLDSTMAEGGSNFSVGQRQLVCLARAILRQNRILVMDEATANVDPTTDALIQVTIREKFQDCTVLTIAHRLNTIMDSDRVMVLDAGYLKEYDEPAILLENPKTIFYGLVEQTGKQNADILIDLARQAAKKRRVTSVNSTEPAGKNELENHVTKDDTKVGEDVEANKLDDVEFSEKL